MVLIRIFEFWKKSQAVNQFSKSIRSRNLGIMYRKFTRSTSVFRFTFQNKWRGFAIIEIGYFSQRYRKFKRRKCSHLPLPPNADRVAKHSHLTSLCWCVLFSVSVLSVGTSWVCYEQCIFVGFSTCLLDIYFLCSSQPWIIWNFVSVFLLLY